MLLPHLYAAISSVLLKPPSKADMLKQLLPVTVFHVNNKDFVKVYLVHTLI
jgi:hypothetical protein